MRFIFRCVALVFWVIAHENQTGFDLFSIARNRLKRNNGIDYDIDCLDYGINVI